MILTDDVFETGYYLIFRFEQHASPKMMVAVERLQIGASATKKRKKK